MRTKPFVISLDGEFNGEGNLLIECADHVFARPGTINYPYSKICNFPAFQNGKGLYTPAYEHRFEEASSF